MLQTFDPRNRDLVVNVAGRLTHRDHAAVSPFDSVVQGGDAVWEGLRLHDGRIFGLAEHLARLRRSAHALAFASVPTDAEITAEIRRTLEANGMRDGVHIRLTLTRGVKVTSGMDPRLNDAGPTLIVLAEWKAPVYGDGAISLITSSLRRAAPDSLDPKIHHNNLLTSIMAKVEANVAGADDALMLDAAGFVAETNATNVFLVLRPAPAAVPGSATGIGAGPDTLRPAAAAVQAATPGLGGSASVLLTPTTRACPEGITRATVIDLARAAGHEVREGDWTLTHVYNAAEMFVTGTMGGLTAVRSVDGRQIGTGDPGPVTTEMRQAYAEHTAASGVPVT